MNREYPAFPLVGVAVVVWHGGKALLIQRGKEPNYGQWSIPGGLIELGETVVAAARREIFEECSITISEPSIFTTVDILKHDAEGRIQYHYLILEFMAHYESGTLVAGDDALAAAWFEPREWGGLALNDETTRVLHQAWERQQAGRPTSAPPND